MSRGHVPIALTIVSLVAATGRCFADPPAPQSEDRAIAYLAREVPLWSRTNHCYSCHNNGDAARALYTAIQLGKRVPTDALSDTNRWLARPEGWDKNGGDGPFSDKRLARAEFASALVAAVETGQVRDRGALERAAKRLAEDQTDDGSWPLDGNGSVGSPATYGRALLTLSARETLHAADALRYRAAIDRADRWLLGQPVSNTPDASAILIAANLSDRPEAAANRRRVVDRLRGGQSQDGGWGPFADAPPEAFDTALALLALSRLKDRTPETRAMIARGRALPPSPARTRTEAGPKPPGRRAVKATPSAFPQPDGRPSPSSPHRTRPSLNAPTNERAAERPGESSSFLRLLPTLLVARRGEVFHFKR